MTGTLATDVLNEIHLQPYIFEDLMNIIVEESADYLMEGMDDMFGDNAYLHVEYKQAHPEAILDIYHSYMLEDRLNSAYFTATCYCKYDVLTEGFDEHDFKIMYVINDNQFSESYEIDKVPPADIMLKENFGWDEFDIANNIDNMTEDILVHLPRFVASANYALSILNKIVNKDISDNQNAIDIVENILIKHGIYSVDDLYED